MVLKFNGLLAYVVHFFEEQHNHPLVGDEDMYFMKLNRKLDHMHQKFILDCASANIRPTHSYNLLTELIGDTNLWGVLLLMCTILYGI